MAALRSIKRTWWIAQQQQQGAEAPLFRELAQRWRPVDRRERRLTPFVLALSSNPAAKSGRTKPALSRIALVAEQMKKSARTWNAWLNVK
jgi:hypothetical protein